MVDARPSPESSRPVLPRRGGSHVSTQWQLQEAKNRLSDVVKQALQHGPQVITLRGEPAVVVLSVREFRALTEPKESLSTFFRSGPLF
ncbi:MAG: type II toxin-antitoxin system Phd/YefM family antitoxin [Leptospirales bacterium]